MYLQGLVFLLCLLYGSVFVFGKLTLDYAPPLFITAARMLLAGVLLLAYQFFFDRKNFILKKTHCYPILIIGLTNVYLTNAFEFWGLQYMEAGKACFLYSFCPIATAVMSYVWFKEIVSVKKWIGLFLGVLGFTPLLVGHSSQADITPSFLFLSMAEIGLLLAATASALGWLAMRETVKYRHYPAVMANGTSMIVGGFLAFIHSLLTEEWNPTPVSDFWPFLQWFICLTVVSNLICYNLHAFLLKRFTATYIAFAGLSQPFFAALVGWIFLEEVLSPYFWLSVMIVSLGLYLYYQDDLANSTP